MQAIQRELSRLTNAKGGNGARPVGTGPGRKSDAKGGAASDLDDESDDADDMADLKVKIEMMEIGSEERKMGVRVRHGFYIDRVSEADTSWGCRNSRG